MKFTEQFPASPSTESHHTQLTGSRELVQEPCVIPTQVTLTWCMSKSNQRGRQATRLGLQVQRLIHWKGLFILSHPEDLFHQQHVFARSRSKLHYIFHPISPLTRQNKYISPLELRGPIFFSPIAFQMKPLKALFEASQLHFQTCFPSVLWRKGLNEPFEVLLPVSHSGASSAQLFVMCSKGGQQPPLFCSCSSHGC